MSNGRKPGLRARGAWSTGSGTSPNPPIVTADDSGYMLQTALQQKFGDSSRPEYRLEVTLNQKLVSEAITKQANTERYSVQVMAEYSLLDSLGTTMVNKTSSTSISYGVVASPYATQVARDNATRTAVEKIAGDIERTLIVYFKDTAETPPVAAAAVAE